MSNYLSGHPKGLYVLFLTEMWERFSFYGMRALLIFYLTQHFLFSDQIATHIYGNYMALVYALPLLGGIIADRYLGFRKAVIFGGILLCFGHFGMSFEGSHAQIIPQDDGSFVTVRDELSLNIFYFSLALIIAGAGFLKPNISTIVGKLYQENDPRRDAGFTLFYMGINLGSVLSTLTVGYLGQTYGWNYGFGLAGIGMLIGLATFIWGQKYLEGHAEPANPACLKEKLFLNINREWIIYLSTLASLFVIWQLVQYQHHSTVGGLLLFFGVTISLWVLIYSIFKCEAVERDRMLVMLCLIFFSIFFWSFFEQAGSSLNLFTDRNVDRVFWGFEIQASQYQSLNAFFIIILAPIFAWMWIALSKRGWEPSTPAKFGLSIIQVGLGFAALVYGASLAGVDAKVASIWLVIAYFFHTTGELCLSPVGLSMITKLSIPRFVGMMMGAWFLSSAAAEYLAALIASDASVATTNGVVDDPVASLAIYNGVFYDITVASLVVGVVGLVFAPLLHKKMHGIH